MLAMKWETMGNGNDVVERTKGIMKGDRCTDRRRRRHSSSNARGRGSPGILLC